MRPPQDANADEGAESASAADAEGAETLAFCSDAGASATAHAKADDDEGALDSPPEDSNEEFSSYSSSWDSVTAMPPSDSYASTSDEFDINNYDWAAYDDSMSG
eukprot:CAMPEP_0170246446 /NCGR_PEP_ID=MMETSP0116_2-20130129/23010_1 /TAXON_ID=400756 /ORGANISM="Durinskia baltica, Strain CSIRO CS-38" /LENGTH=103 /DNA_ID=CAMNT_0010497323 /DNA_START=279 /DNA_END=591 /DNA_ORIENTATION=+